MRRRTEHAGLTLVEMMAVLAIGAVLLSASLLAATRIARAQVRLHAEPEPTLAASLDRLLADDFRHVRRVRTVAGGFEIRTLGKLDCDTFRRRQCPVVVSYVVADDGSGRLLRRQKTDGKDQTLEHLVCLGVKEIELSTSTTEDTNVLPDGWRLASGEMTVRLTFADGREPIKLTVRRAGP